MRGEADVEHRFATRCQRLVQPDFHHGVVLFGLQVNVPALPFVHGCARVRIVLRAAQVPALALPLLVGIAARVVRLLIQVEEHEPQRIGAVVVVHQLLLCGEGVAHIVHAAVDGVVYILLPVAGERRPVLPVVRIVRIAERIWRVQGIVALGQGRTGHGHQHEQDYRAVSHGWSRRY